MYSQVLPSLQSRGHFTSQGLGYQEPSFVMIRLEEVSISNAQALVEVSRGCIAKPLRCSQARPWHQMSAAYLPGEQTPDFLTVSPQAQTLWGRKG